MDKYNDRLQEKTEKLEDKISEIKTKLKNKPGVNIEKLKKIEKLLEEKEYDLNHKPDHDRFIAIPVSFNTVILFSDYMIEIILLCVLVALNIYTCQSVFIWLVFSLYKN